MAVNPQILHHGLEVQHQVWVLANVLPHLIDHENQSVTGAFAIEVVANGAGKLLSAEGVVLVVILYQAVGSLFSHASAGHQGLNDILLVEQPGIAAVFPGLAARLLKSLLKVLVLVTGI